MSIAEQINQLLHELHERLSYDVAGKKKRLAELNVEKSQIESDLAAAEKRAKNLIGFQSIIDGREQCPKCFLLRREQIAVKSIGGGTDTHDNWRCPVCNFSFSTET